MLKFFGVILLNVILVVSGYASSEKVLPHIPEPNLLPGGGNGAISTGFSNLQTLNPSKYKKNEVLFKLRDGTRVGGLYFPRKKNARGADRLLIGTFGFMSDRWSAPVTQFVNEYIQKNKVKANVLILDHPTSGSFYALNDSVSFGGYDEARMILEITEQLLKNEDETFISNDFKSIHLIGISMGGNGVLNTILEAQRLNKNYYKSAAIFSTVFDLYKVPRKQISGFDRYDYWGENSSTAEDRLGIRFLYSSFKKAFRNITDEYFKSKYDDIGELYYHEFNKRMVFLQQLEKDIDWNHKISVLSIGSYLRSNILYDYAQDIRTPIYVVSSKDDPTVQYSQFENFENEAQDNPYITTMGYKHGGHWGYTWAFGPEFIEEVLNNIFSVE